MKISNQKISLRGTLADDYLQLAKSKGVSRRTLEDFVYNLLYSNNPLILKTSVNGSLVIGKADEKGKFLPDW